MGHIVIVGATGLIGSHIAAAVTAQGRTVVAVSRSAPDGSLSPPAGRRVALDIAKATTADWLPLLAEAEAVVNCAGALQDGPADDLKGTHDRGTAVLAEACESAGVRRFVHFSAMGVGEATPSDFSRTKLAGDRTLMAGSLDWVVLRPSVVLGPAAYGASALIRGLASLPILPLMPDTGSLRPVVLEDVIRTVLFFLSADAPARVVVNLSGPDRFEFSELVSLYRRWLGYAPARTVRLPSWLAGLAYRAGDLAGRLGWRPPVRSTARLEIARGAAADSPEWTSLTGIVPQNLATALSAHPASVQERWFAGLYLVKPFVFASLAIFWIGSGLASIGPGYPAGIALLQQGGAAALAPYLVIGGGLLDLAIGLGIAVRRTARRALQAGMAVSVLYALAGSAVTPWLWLDPLAPLLKIAPILALQVVALVMLRDR